MVINKLRRKISHLASNNGRFRFFFMIVEVGISRFESIVNSDLVDVYGDSHSEIFWDVNKALGRKVFRVVSIKGATISGLRNPNSSTDAKRVIEWNLRKKPPKKLLLMFGEVDLGFLVIAKSIKDDIPLVDLLDELLLKYKRFVINVLEKVNCSLFLVGVPLPFIKEYKGTGDVAKSRSIVNLVPLEKRFEIIEDFNRKIKDFSVEIDAEYIDINDGVLESRSVKEVFFSVDGEDHHYRSDTFSRHLAFMLENKGFFK